jgi:hypothetical protein
LISFGIKYGFILLPAVLAAAAGIVILLYFKNRENRELSRQQKGVLMVLRFLSFGLVAFLLLSPFFRSLKKIVRQPLIIAAWDNSGSIVSSGDSIQLTAEVMQLKERFTEELGSRYALVNYSFGQETERDRDLDFSEKKSDYSHLFSTLSRNHYNENIGALILAGDGIYNQGKNPVNLLEEISFPVFTIGLGDTTGISDARIQGIRVNRTSFSGNRFPLEVDARFIKQKGRSLQLTIREGEDVLAQTMITPPNDDYFKTQEFILEAGNPGLRHFDVILQVAENERNRKNNRSTFVVHVLESKQKILILSDGPHPDAGALKNTLDKQKAYEVSLFTGEPYPSNFTDFNLVILNQLPTAGRSMAGIIEKNAARRVPLLYLVGSKTYIPQLNALSGGAEIRPLAGSPEEVQAVVNSSYTSFALSESFREVLPKFPPLTVPFASYNLDPEFSVLLYQKVKNIETGRPLLATGIMNGRKTGFLFGEGIWRWRINNYYQNQTHHQFDEWINQLVQYLALQNNEDNFMITYEPVYAETDPVVLNAEVYNDVFEKITTEEVTIVIKNEQGDELDFTFDVRGNGYHLNAGNLPVGNYSFEAEVTLGNQTYSEAGSFAVTAVNLENIVTQANHRLLYQLASQSGGTFSLPGQADRIMDELKSSDRLKTVTYFREMTNELLNLRWLFFVILLLFSMEWFLRKFWGIY